MPRSLDQSAGSSMAEEPHWWTYSSSLLDLHTLIFSRLQCPKSLHRKVMVGGEGRVLSDRDSGLFGRAAQPR
jgi:hypothetical protein